MLSKVRTKIDQSVKNNVEPINDATQILSLLNPKTYYYQSPENRLIGFEDDIQYGFIAQEVQEILPDIVEQVHVPEMMDSTGFVDGTSVDLLGIQYESLIPIDRWSTILFFLQQGAFIVALTIPFDVRDLKTDYEYQRTLPMVFGVSRSIKIAENAMIFAFVFAFFNYLIGFFGFPQMLVQLGISIIGVLLVRRGKIHRRPLYYSILLDGMIILQGVALLMI